MTKTNFDLTGIFSKSWEIFKKYLGFFVLYFLITMALGIPNNMDTQMQRIAESKGELYLTNPLLSFLILVCFIASIIVSYGYIFSLLKMVKDIAVTIKDLWYPKINILSIFGAGLILFPLYLVITLIVFTPFFISIFSTLSQLIYSPSDINWISFIFSNLLIFLITLLVSTVVNLLLMTRLGFISYFIIDKNLGPINGIKASWNATKGKFLSLLLFFIQIIGLNILGALALGVGLFITIPLSSIAMTYVYLKLSGDADLDEIDDFSEIETVSPADDKEVETVAEAVSDTKKPVVVKKVKKSVLKKPPVEKA
jgi:uncharacterized membrane protein